jgi:Txe/YoeB family toxin of Txe-Axe toxin-antitoxin module
MEKHCNNSQCFKEKNYKTKFLISSILKKIDRNNFRKKITKQTPKEGKKKSCWKHCSNSQYFVMKAIVLPNMI